jgi:xanthine dehydrogenase YagT iron-sulfur-binding subunit
MATRFSLGPAEGPGSTVLTCDGDLHAIGGGGPWVLAFYPGLSGSTSARAGEALLAELRGLGASLAILRPDGGTLLRPDDSPQPLRPAPALWARHGAPPDCATLVVLDGEGRARLRRTLDASADVESMLLRALRDAARARVPARGVGRRELLVSALAAAVGAVVLDACAGAQRGPKQGAPEQRPAQTASSSPGLIDVALVINGERRVVRIEPRVTLLDALREQLGLTGTKKGCDMGQCGACTVLVDGKRIDSCLALAVQHEGREITTIEGLARGEDLHPMQAAFLEQDAFQCGYCTPGQILSAVALLAEHKGQPLDDDAIREGMSGNLCRCGAYPNIVAAVRGVAGRS